MSHLDPAIAHLLRRAGFGLNAADADSWNRLGLAGAVARLVDYESVPDDVDDSIGVPGYLGTTSRGPFEPDRRISDARQRWLFRLVHTQRPLQEKMALFWHNHFATGFGKIAGQIGPRAASRALGEKPDPGFSNIRGQLEVFRDLALGNFEQLLRTVSQDPAMVAWLDGDTNTKEKPQENYARELMELFTIGVDTFTESDVHAGARVFTGWNLQYLGFDRDDPSLQHVVFFYNPRQHDTEPKTFSFPIYPDGGQTIPRRPGVLGMQDGHDLIAALVRHPETGPRLARKLYAFFVNEFDPPDEALVQKLSATYYATGFNMREVVRELLLSDAFHDPANHWTRYSWPVELVARMIREVGWSGFSAGAAIVPLANMGQTLFEPPNVSGWSLGPAWFSTGTMLARMNFAASLAENQRFAIAGPALGAAASPASFLNHFLDQLTLPDLSNDVRAALLEYLESGGGWTGSSSQVTTKSSGLVHLLAASSEYQFV
jgi:uncharacterized protein (DUF1800 family)